MVRETWVNRDLPVLRAAVELWEESGRGPRATAIERATGFDADTVQRALRTLYTEPYFRETSTASGGHRILVGAPTSAALRAVGQWPTPEGLLDRLLAAFEAAADDEARPDEERSRFKKAAAAFGGVVSQVAINTFGSAGGNLLTG